ncbi:MAG: hypothetical protein ACR2M1_09790 [Gemmatimonadaceae bacterium]
MIHATLAGWGNFYLITGTAAAALTGLQFIVQTLLTSDPFRPATEGDPEGGIEAFGTPTVVHFTLALVVSAMMCVPWPGYGGLRATLGVLGAGALGYSAIVLRRARRQRSYIPVAEDWVWHILLPVAAYAAVLVAAVLLGRGVAAPLFVVAAATLLLIGVGVHNAWDTVTYLTLSRLRALPSEGEPAPPRRDVHGTHGRRRR